MGGFAIILQNTASLQKARVFLPFPDGDYKQLDIPKRTPGIFFAFLSAIIFVTLNIAILFSEPYLTVWRLMFSRCLFGVAAMVALARFGGSILWVKSCTLLFPEFS
jgi:hypothetical protein